MGSQGITLSGTQPLLMLLQTAATQNPRESFRSPACVALPVKDQVVPGPEDAQDATWVMLLKGRGSQSCTMCTMSKDATGGREASYGRR